MSEIAPASGLVGLLIQGGAVAIALVALWVIYKMNGQMSETLRQIASDHRATIDRNTDAWLKNTDVVASLKETINRINK
jgi:hypothetical protein